ncbi:MAG: hypothetical protein JNK15_23595 [Planctomycetes bacterium]|nr:hypothetical protein [Planctomycetota bacterium]
MNRPQPRSASAFALAAALALAPAMAQEEHGVSFTLLVQAPPGDLVLNTPLLNAVLGEPDLHTALKQAFGDHYENIRSCDANLPAPHAPGTFQLQVGMLLHAKSPFVDEHRAKATDVVVAHLRSRLESMLVAEPRERLQARRTELLDRLVALQGEVATIVDGNATLRNQLATRQDTERTLGEQMIAARIELATTESTLLRLQAMHKEQTAKRDVGREKLQAINNELNPGRSRATELHNRLADLVRGREDQPPSKEAAALQADIAELANTVQVLDARRDETNEQLNDAGRILAVLLEKLPAQTIELQRAEARIQALEKELRTALSATDPTTTRQSLAAGEAKLERLTIDLAVVKTLLTECEGQLARIQPLQCRLLRARG